MLSTGLGFDWPVVWYVLFTYNILDKYQSDTNQMLQSTRQGLRTGCLYHPTTTFSPGPILLLNQRNATQRIHHLWMNVMSERLPQHQRPSTYQALWSTVKYFAPCYYQQPYLSTIMYAWSFQLPVLPSFYISTMASPNTTTTTPKITEFAVQVSTSGCSTARASFSTKPIHPLLGRVRS